MSRRVHSTSDGWRRSRTPAATIGTSHYADGCAPRASLSASTTCRAKALPRAGNGAPPFSIPDADDGTAVRLSAPGAVPHDVAHQVAHVVLQISDDVLDDVSDREHAHDLARVQHW